MKKKILLGLCILFSVLFLMTATGVNAKPTSIYFFAPDGEWTIDSTNPTFDDSGKMISNEVHLSGNLRTTTFPPTTWATFTSVDNFHFYYDKNGVQKYYTVDRTMVITRTGGSDTLTIDGQIKLIAGVPMTFQRSGSWTIVDGTGLYAAVTGGGAMRWVFEFYGNIK